MTFSRREAFKKILTGGVIVSSPAIVLAEDYSIRNNPEQKRYVYNPFEGNINKQANSFITNDILPQRQNTTSFWDMPRSIQLYRKQTGESAQIVYYSNGMVNMQDYKTACYLLRDVQQNKLASIDLRLLDLICAVQAWLKHYGYNSPIMVNSGFRTVKTNSSLEGAAKNSMHLYGRAIDFSIPNLPPFELAKIAAQFRAGGIGIYPNQNFIHLDTGGVRVWIKNKR